MKKILLLFTIFTLSLSTEAGNRTKTKMLQLAEEHMAKHKSGHNRASGEAVKLIAERPMMSVYSDGTQFSIISSDDRYHAVLAYGNGSFDMDSVPANVKWWMTSVEQAMASGIAEQQTETYTAVEPLMTAKWGQYAPYNNLMPEVKGDKNKKSNAPTGCVATAMAQILNTIQYPASVNFEGSYTIDGSETPVKEQVTETFSWPYKIAYGSYLPDGYTSDHDVKTIYYTTQQGNAVACLLRACGYAVNMDYSYEGSGALLYDAGHALVEKFQFPEASVKYLSRDFYSTEEWLTILNREFQNGSPVLYGGYGGDSESEEDLYGHAFVLHGMDSDGLVYINWGWQGDCDGYYAIDLLQPYEDVDLSIYQEGVVGFRPQAVKSDVFQSFVVTEKPYTVSYKSSRLTLTLKGMLYNNSIYDLEGDIRCIVKDMTDGDVLLTEYLMEDDVLQSGYGWESGQALSKKLSLSAGHTYRVYLESKDDRETDWQMVRTIGGPIYYEISYSEKGKATISDAIFYDNNGATAIQAITADTDNSSNTLRYFDLQGREVDANAHGLVIVKQGNTVKKVFK